jgi:hypothetical protein
MPLRPTTGMFWDRRPSQQRPIHREVLVRGQAFGPCARYLCFAKTPSARKALTNQEDPGQQDSSFKTLFRKDVTMLRRRQTFRLEFLRSTAAARQSLVTVNHHDLFERPSQGKRPIPQSVPKCGTVLACQKEEGIGLEHCCLTHELVCNKAARCEVSPRTLRPPNVSQDPNQLFLAGR